MLTPLSAYNEMTRYKPILILSLTLVAQPLLADPACLPNTPQSLVSGSFSEDLTKTSQYLLCQGLSSVTDKGGFEKHLKAMITEQQNKISASSNRHEAGTTLNQCDVDQNSKALVISFAGTGAYNPISHAVLTELIQCEHFQKLAPEIKKSTYNLIYGQLKTSDYAKWSGIDAGPMQLFLNDEKVNEESRRYQFASFPSEESELISDPDKISLKSLKKIPEEIAYSKASFPQGIQNALDCVQKYYSQAKAKGIKPKLIVMSHSSGGRSVVKFLEQLKKSPFQKRAHLVLSIDPVKEAHHAIQEVLEQVPQNTAVGLINKIPKVKIKNTPVNVWTRNQPSSLYKPGNADRWINFYQQEDTEGIGMPIKFGIHGSPIAGADENIFIKKGLGAKGHGEITYHDKTLEKIKDEVLGL